VTTLLTGVEQPEHRRLLHAYATWQILRRLRRRATNNTTGRTPTGYPCTQLLVATRFLGWLDHTSTALAQCRQGDVDTWLADGPAGYPVRDFLGWAAEHHYWKRLYHGRRLLLRRQQAPHLRLRSGQPAAGSPLESKCQL